MATQKWKTWQVQADVYKPGVLFLKNKQTDQLMNQPRLWKGIDKAVMLSALEPYRELGERSPVFSSLFSEDLSGNNWIKSTWATRVCLNVMPEHHEDHLNTSDAHSDKRMNKGIKMSRI